MLADISVTSTHSNFPPTANEETLLRALFKQKEDELDALSEQILKARSAVASAKEAIQKLTKCGEFALKTMVTYERHIKHLRSSFAPPETWFTFVPAAPATESSDPMPCVAVIDLLRPDLLKRRESAKLEIEELEQICVKVKAFITDIDENLRCQHYIDEVHSKSLESYLVTHAMAQSAVDEISGAFRAIKRVPNEIWSIILSIRITDDSTWNLNATSSSLFLPALPISQVCRTWRSVVTSSPYMWKAIQWSLSSGDEPSLHYIERWIEMTGKKALVVYEKQYNGHTSAAQTLRNHPLDRSKSLVYNIIQYSGGIPSGFDADNTHEIRILALALHAPPSSRHLRVQPELYSQFNSVQQLVISDLLPHSGLALQNTLTSLTIQFSQPHKSYTLARLLLPGLLYLRLEHFEMTRTPSLPEAVQLPNLLVLGITPLEYRIAGKLEMPKLSVLKLFSPAKVSACPDGWLASIIALSTTVDHLRIDCSSMGKSKKHRDTMGFDVIQILTKLLPQTQELERITLVGAIFEGEGLTDIFEEKEIKEGVKFRKLKELTIDNCIGVSRMDCERLVQYVEKLNVYRTVHKSDDIQE